MEKLISELCEILEVESLPLGSSFEDLAEWDSLNALSVIALLESNYNLRIDSASLTKYVTIDEFVRYVVSQNN